MIRDGWNNVPRADANRIMAAFFGGVVAFIAALGFGMNSTLVIWIAGWALASIVWYRGGNDESSRGTKLGTLCAFVIFTAVIWTWTLGSAIQPEHFTSAVVLKALVGIGVLAVVGLLVRN